MLKYLDDKSRNRILYVSVACLHGPRSRTQICFWPAWGSSGGVSYGALARDCSHLETFRLELGNGPCQTLQGHAWKHLQLDSQSPPKIEFSLTWHLDNTEAFQSSGGSGSVNASGEWGLTFTFNRKWLRFLFFHLQKFNNCLIYLDLLYVYFLQWDFYFSLFSCYYQ